MGDDISRVSMVGRVLAKVIDEVFHCYSSVDAWIMPLIFWLGPVDGSACNKTLARKRRFT
jgi:hypothetical protein